MSDTERSEEGLDTSKAPLLDHLIELRRRLLWSFAALAVAFGVCLYFARPIFGILVQPLLAAGQGRLIYTNIFEAFFVEIKVAFVAAFLLPVLLMLLEAAGLVTRQQLKKGRRYAIVIAFVVAAVLTPPDVVSQ